MIQSPSRGTVQLAVLLSASLLGFLSGCQNDADPQSLQLLQGSYKNFDNGQYDKAAASADQFLLRCGGSAQANSAHYIRGLCRYKIHKFDAAKTDMQTVLDRSKTASLRVGAMITLGDMAFDEGKLSEAESFYRQSLDLIQPGHPPADHAEFQLGCIYQRQGRWLDADPHLDRVVYFFGTSKIARQAARLTHARAWTLIARRFSSSHQAQQHAAQLSAKGLAAVVAVDAAESCTYCVRVGRYEKYDLAKAAAEMAGQADWIIVPVP